MVGITRGTGGPNPLAATRAFDENPKISAVLRDLAQRAKNGGASSIMFFPQKGTQYESYAFAYHTGLAKEMNITRAADSQKMRGHIAINISGHASGGIQDRVVAHAENAFARQGARVGDDAKRFLALREAVQQAVSEFSRNPGAQAITVSFEGKTVDIPRASYDKMQRARIDSDDSELSQIAWAGNQALQKFFASTNTYNVRVRTADGQTTVVRDIPRNNPDKVEYSTKIPIEFSLLDGETVLEAWPTGSAEVAGYVEARRYKIHFGNNQFDVDKAVEAADKYKAAHPEIRWDTDHEDEDLEKHHVSPAPYPYQDF